MPAVKLTLSEIEELFWSQVLIGDGCWSWTGRRDKDGYGRFYADGRERGAHRVSFSLWSGTGWIKSAHVLHRCDNPTCVRPSHLFLGTTQENTADKVAKGRHPRGEAHAGSKLTGEDVGWICAAHAKGVRIAHIARAHEVSPALVYAVVHGLIWTHVVRS